MAAFASEVANQEQIQPNKYAHFWRPTRQE